VAELAKGFVFHFRDPGSNLSTDGKYFHILFVGFVIHFRDPGANLSTDEKNILIFCLCHI
jgi:hypothetical protein